MPVHTDPSRRIKTAEAQTQRRPSEPLTTEERERLYVAVIGDQSTDYYVEKFQSFDEAGRTRMTANRGAATGTGLWFFWRGLWLPGLLYLVYAAAVVISLFYITNGLGDLWQQISAHEKNERAAVFWFVGILFIAVYAAGAMIFTWQGILIMLVLTVFAQFPPFMVNALYYRHCNRRINAAMARYRSVGAAEKALSLSGGVSYAGLFVGIVVLVVMVNFGWGKLNQEKNDNQLGSTVSAANESMRYHLMLIGSRFSALNKWTDHSSGNIGVYIRSNTKRQQVFYFKRKVN